MKISEKTRKWLKRVGWAGFFFFLLKGILWMVAGAAIFEWVREKF